MLSRRDSFRVVLGIGVAAMLVACATPPAAPAKPAGSGASAQPAAQALKKVRFGVAVLVLPLASIWVAQSKGFFTAEGLDVDLRVAPGIQGTQGVVAGSLDFMSGGASDLMIAAAKGEQLQAV